MVASRPLCVLLTKERTGIGGEDRQRNHQKAKRTNFVRFCVTLHHEMSRNVLGLLLQ